MARRPQQNNPVICEKAFIIAAAEKSLRAEQVGTVRPAVIPSHARGPEGDATTAHAIRYIITIEPSGPAALWMDM